MKTIPSNCFNSQVHGDFNISNILFKDHKVSGIILGLAENALYGAAISAKNGDARCAEECRKQLLDYLKILGYCPQQIPPITFKNPEIQ